MTPGEIEKLIQSQLAKSKVYVLDPMNDGKHLEALVISPVFEGLPLVAQHKKVMSILKDALRQELHALGLKTFTPQRWEHERKTYHL